jgi:hypothetical protein
MITSKNLNLYIIESKKAIEQLQQEINIEIPSLIFQNILGEKLGYPDGQSHLVVECNLRYFEMLSIVKADDFKLPTETFKVEFDESILPDGIVIPLNEERIKVKGEIWLIHMNDADPLPSNPHGHNEESGYKLHLGTGDLYTSKNKPMNSKISKKNLLAIRNKVKNITLPPLAI